MDLAKVRLKGYHPDSASAKSLSDALGVKRLKHQGSSWRGRNGSVLICYGLVDLPAVDPTCVVLNHPDVVRRVSNKRTFFEHCGQNEFVVPWTTRREDVLRWLSEGKTVVGRSVLSGHSGQGIVMLNPKDNPDTWNLDLSLYTVYVPKKEEYRIHVAFGKTIDVQRKLRKSDVPDDQVDWRVRNLSNGFIYARNDIKVPDAVTTAVAGLVDVLDDLDFGAYDVIYNEKANRAYVLEVNTAPGLKGTTLDNYAAAFREYLKV